MAFVLVVEDDRNLGRIFEKTLQQSGHEVHFAHTLLEASRLVKRVDPDIITLDWHVGAETSEPFLDTITQIPATMRPPILAITGDSRVKSTEIITKVALKPISVGKLADHVMTMLRQSTKQPYEEIQIRLLDKTTVYLKWSGRISPELIRANMHPDQHAARTVIFDISDLSAERFRLEQMGRPKHPLIPNLERILFVVPSDLLELSQYLMAFIHKPLQVDYFETLEAAQAALNA